MFDRRVSHDKERFSCSSTRASSNAFKRNAGFAYVVPLSRSEADEFEAIAGSITVSDACGQAQWTAWQGYLQVNSFTDRQIAAGTDACTTFSQVNGLTINIGGCVLKKDTDPDFLLEAVTRETPPNGMVDLFHFSGHRCLWYAGLPKCYAAMSNQA